MLEVFSTLLSTTVLNTWSQSIPQQIVPVFLGSNDALFPAIMTAIRPIAVVGILFKLYAMVPEFSDLEKIAENLNRLFWMSIITLVIINANTAKYLAIFQWAMIGGINEQIAFNIDAIKNTSVLMQNYQGDIQAMAKIQDKAKLCQQITAINADGTPNPAMAICQTELQTQINIASTDGTIKQQSILDKLLTVGTAIGTGDINKIVGAVGDTAANFLSGFASPLISVIFSAWRSAIESI
jgi:hypothetical protein